MMTIVEKWRRRRQRRQSNALYIAGLKLRDIREDWINSWRPDVPEEDPRWRPWAEFVVEPLHRIQSDIEKIASELALDSGAKWAGYPVPPGEPNYVPNSAQGIYSGNPETQRERQMRGIK